MEHYKTMTGRHLTLKQRNLIQEGLYNGLNFSQIADFICKDPTTVSKEVKRNRKRWVSTFNKSAKFSVKCVHSTECRKNNKKNRLCGLSCECGQCPGGATKCSSFKKETCPKVTKAPYVCNGCEKRAYCSLEKYIYDATYADREYRKSLSESRKGCRADEAEIARLKGIVEPLMERGQSLQHIHASHKDELGISCRTLYNYVSEDRYFGDLFKMRQKVQRKPVEKPENKDEKKKKKQPSVFKDRTYKDFLAYMQDKHFEEVTEMDTVEFVKGEAVLLTMVMRSTNILMCFKMERCTQQEVVNVLNRIEQIIGTELFMTVCGTILTDRGSEFSSPSLIETGINGEKRTKVFYCDPGKPSQKPYIENTHKYIRYFFPKSKSISKYGQEVVWSMANNINNTIRPTGLKEYTPMDIAEVTMPEEFLKKMNLKKIAADDVTLTLPALLKDTNR